MTTAEKVPRMTWEDAMWNYGNDKPDIRFEWKLLNLKNHLQFIQIKRIHQNLIDGAGFGVFDNAETVVAIAVPGCSEYSRQANWMN